MPTALIDGLPLPHKHKNHYCHIQRTSILCSRVCNILNGGYIIMKVPLFRTATASKKHARMKGKCWMKNFISNKNNLENYWVPLNGWKPPSTDRTTSCILTQNSMFLLWATYQQHKINYSLELHKNQWVMMNGFNVDALSLGIATRHSYALSDITSHPVP